MRGEPEWEEHNDKNIGVNDNVFFDLEFFSNSDKKSEYVFFDEIPAGVNFLELGFLQIFIGITKVQ